VPEQEFVTVSRAALVLQVSERSVRRAAALLPDTDRQKRQGSPALLRLSALASQMGRGDLLEGMPDKTGTQTGTPDTAGQEKAALPDTGEGVAGHAGQGQAGESALVAELRAERDAWKAQAEKALQLVDQAQQLQLVAERKVAELEGKLLPAMEPEVPQNRAGASQSEDSGMGGVIAPPETEKRGIWSFLRRWW
jgi:hypothetical protein